MKYLTISPNYTQSCIRDDIEGPIELSCLELPESIVNEIKLWHQRYREIIPLSMDERQKISQTIEELDQQGIKIALKIKELLNAKVKYFSEGKLKYLIIS